MLMLEVTEACMESAITLSKVMWITLKMNTSCMSWVLLEFDEVEHNMPSRSGIGAAMNLVELLVS